MIIPALDEAASIAAAIGTARAAGADEIIVVDGGSSDGTAEIAAGLSDAALSAPRGRALQMNAGAAAAGGDVLLFLHADTLVPAGAIGELRSACRDRRVVGGAFSVELRAAPGGSLYRRTVLRATGPMINLRARLFRAYTGDQGIFVRRDVFEDVGRYPEIALMEDVELSRRIAARGRTVLLGARLATSARRWEARGPLRTILLMWGLRIAHRLGMSPARCASIYRGTPR